MAYTYQPQAQNQPQGRRPWWQRTLKTVVLLALVLLLAIAVRAFLFQMYVVASGSMEPTLMTGQRIVAFRLAPAPARNDIVVFTPVEEDVPTEGFGALLETMKVTLHPDEAPTVLVKRVIGIEGDTIYAEDGVLYINGTAQMEPYAVGPTYDFGPITVPENHIYAMGDNRASSLDSRVFGPVPVTHIVAEMVWDI